ncbi:MAG TPA: hypothetical protein PLO67_23600, partial [Saprospiraceae bacterium]|nr:hypothetical protein [Saprospiraceae bacterium]
LMGRMGRFYYARASGSAVEEIVQEVTAIGVGFDGLPETLLHSQILTGNNLAQLASLTVLPDESGARQTLSGDTRAQMLIAQGATIQMQAYAKELLDRGALSEGAAMAILSSRSL